VFASLAVAVATLPVGAVRADATVWLDPSTLPFVPAPVIAHAFAPSDPGNVCTGAGSYSPGPRPAYVDDLVLHVDVFACAIRSADVVWTIDGQTYSGAVDAATGAVTQIHRVAENPYAVGGASATVATSTPSQPSLGTQGTGGGTGTCAQNGTPRDSHTWLHFWADSGSGNENVKTNLNWKYAATCQVTTDWSYRCDADGIWRNDKCSGSMVQGHSASGHGDFHAVIWPNDNHSWDTTDTIQPDETTTGTCLPSGDLPWSYGSTCDNGPGNV